MSDTPKQTKPLLIYFGGIILVILIATGIWNFGLTSFQKKMILIFGVGFILWRLFKR